MAAAARRVTGLRLALLLLASLFLAALLPHASASEGRGRSGSVSSGGGGAKPKRPDAPPPTGRPGRGAGTKKESAKDKKKAALAVIERYVRLLHRKVGGRCFSSGTFVLEVPPAGDEAEATWNRLWSAISAARVSRGIAKTHDRQSQPALFAASRWCAKVKKAGDPPCDDAALRGGGCANDGATQYELEFPRPLEYLCRPQCVGVKRPKGKNKNNPCDEAFKTPKEAGLLYRFCLVDGAGSTRSYVFFKLEETGTQGIGNKLKHTADFISAKTGLRKEPPGFEFRRDTEVDYWTRNCRSGKPKPPYSCAKSPAATLQNLRARVATAAADDMAAFRAIVDDPGAQALMESAAGYFEWNVRVGAEMFVPFVVTDAVVREMEGMAPATPRPVPDAEGDEGGDDESGMDEGSGSGSEEDDGFTVGGPPKASSPLGGAMDDEETLYDGSGSEWEDDGGRPRGVAVTEKPARGGGARPQVMPPPQADDW